MHEIEQLEGAARKHSGIMEKQLSFFEGGKFMHQFATQQVAIAVAKRDEEIAKWLDDRHHYYEHPDFYIHVNVAEYKQFLSTPTSAEIAQVQPEPTGVEPSIKVSELKDFLFNMHEVENGKIYLTVENVNQFINSKKS